MTRARITWRVPRWSQAQWVAEQASRRAKYGVEFAEAVEMVAHMIRDRRDRPRAQDIKATLAAIAARPEAAALRRLDGYTEAALVTVALRLHGVIELRTLDPEQLAECARQAMLLPRRNSGGSETDDLSKMLFRLLLRLLPDTTAPAERDEILADAMRACRLGASQKNIARLLAEVGQEV